MSETSWWEWRVERGGRSCAVEKHAFALEWDSTAQKKLAADEQAGDPRSDAAVMNPNHGNKGAVMKLGDTSAAAPGRKPFSRYPPCARSPNPAAFGGEDFERFETRKKE